MRQIDISALCFSIHSRLLGGSDSYCGGLDADCNAALETGCNSPLVCNSATGDTCQNPGAPGSSCGTASNCAGPVECSADNICGGEGAICSSNRDDLCDTANSLICNSVENECTQPHDVGESCGEAPDCLPSLDCSLLSFTCGMLSYVIDYRCN